MTRYAPNYTTRLRIKYRAFGYTHHMTFRGVVGSEQNGAEPLSVVASDLFGVLASLLPTDWQVITWDFAEQDSDIFLPYGGALPTAVGGSNVGQMSPAGKALSISFVGRSTLGGRAMFEIFGFNFATGPGIAQDFRVTSTESAVINDAVTTLNSAPKILAANDGGAVSWYPYVNVKYNDHWVSKLRAGS